MRWDAWLRRPGSDLEVDFLGHKSVNAALHFVEAGPAAGAFVFPVASFFGARPAADRAIALIMQRVVGNLVLAQVFPNRLPGPIGHRVYLHDFAAAIFVEHV